MIWTSTTSPAVTRTSKIPTYMMDTTPPHPSSFQHQQYDALNLVENAGNKNSLKPFFLMDWLDEFVSPDQDVYKLAELLQTPGKLNDMEGHSSVSLSSPSLLNRFESTSSSPSSSPPPPQLQPSSFSSQPSTPKSSNRKKKTSFFGNCLNNMNNSLHLQTSSSSGSSSDALSSSETVKPQRLFHDSTGRSVPEATSKTKSKRASSGSKSKGHQRQHSAITLGNGWNAKGLKKAQQGQWKDALACWDVALELRVPVLSPMSEEVANTWNNRGIALGKLGRYSEALYSLNKALEIRLHNHHTNATNDTRSDSTKDCNNADSNGDIHNTTKWSRRKSKESSACTNTVIISTYHNIANVHQQAGDYGKALEVFGHAKALCMEEYEGCNVDGNNNNSAEDGSKNSNNNRNVSSSSMLSMARLCTAMGHVYYQVDQWIDARDAYHDAVWVYQQLQEQQKLQQKQAPMYDYRDELKELRRDIQELDHKILLQQKLQQELHVIENYK